MNREQACKAVSHLVAQAVWTNGWSLEGLGVYTDASADWVAKGLRGTSPGTDATRSALPNLPARNDPGVHRVLTAPPVEAEPSQPRSGRLVSNAVGPDGVARSELRVGQTDFLLSAREALDLAVTSWAAAHCVERSA